ncbi:TIGR03915 family putative DNA repair protein [Dorea acetigenes]|uniref:TIGR03915 family putative DNA repair protein n=1 Tax=Dorea acetigenes TaxID=2981787 RepID=A0ABT2RMA1_9FIRM|nr:TIGR03915 family putative DNA repair protein [Dorea acetigenes]MCB6414711.1 TIGR03915 family putative DNA repair protein [Faecalimonas umbilicata]MCU6686520.1 TIGR03915 family putative DNA repair protein [Dorea acetigenes]SCI98573.1 probable DNA metabolism protein [uncultured Clostridium sp.]
MRKMYICTDSVTGIFSAVYEAWKSGRDSDTCGIVFRGKVEQELFCEYCEIEESERKALAVEKMILRHLGERAYWDIYHAALSEREEKGNAILGAMLEARRIPDSTKIMDHLSHPMVEKVFEMSRSVDGEAHQLKGFLRFRELEGGILFAEITPKNRVLTCLAPHFSDRLPTENWMIYDKNHREIALHEAGKRWVLASDDTLDFEKTRNISEAERHFSELWKGFCRTISIEERSNPRCQRQHLPLWYRVNMTEFDAS